MKSNLTPSANYDVIILGGGPAGAATAISIANAIGQDAISNYSILIVESRLREQYDKPCGGFLTQHAIRVLKSLNIPQDFPHQVINNISISNQGGAHGQVVDGSLLTGKGRRYAVPFEEFGLVVHRRYFDEYLRNHAERLGVDIFSPYQAIEINNETNDDYFSVRLLDKTSRKQLSIRSKIIIGADGASGLSRKKALRYYDKNAKKQIKQGYAWRANIPYAHLNNAVAEDEVNLNFFNSGSSMSYSWIFAGKTEANSSFQKGDLLNIGFGHIEKEPTRHTTPRETFEKYFPGFQGANAKPKNSENKTSISGGVIPFYMPFFNRLTKPIYQPNGRGFPILALTGDALGLASPISGEGIGQALSSGEYLGNLIGQSLKQKSDSTALIRKYSSWINWRSDLALLGTVETLFFWLGHRPHRFSAMWKTIENKPVSGPKFAARIITRVETKKILAKLVKPEVAKFVVRFVFVNLKHLVSKVFPNSEQSLSKNRKN